MILPVCSFEDVPYGVYVTAKHIAIASEWGRGVYSNALEMFSSNTTSYEDIRTQDIIFDAMEYQQRYRKTLLRLVAHIYRLCLNVCRSFLYNTWTK